MKRRVRWRHAFLFPVSKSDFPYPILLRLLIRLQAYDVRERIHGSARSIGDEQPTNLDRRQLQFKRIIRARDDVTLRSGYSLAHDINPYSLISTARG